LLTVKSLSDSNYNESTTQPEESRTVIYGQNKKNIIKSRIDLNENQNNNRQKASKNVSSAVQTEQQHKSVKQYRRARHHNTIQESVKQRQKRFGVRLGHAKCHPAQ